MRHFLQRDLLAGLLSVWTMLLDCLLNLFPRNQIEEWTRNFFVFQLPQISTNLFSLPDLSMSQRSPEAKSNPHLTAGSQASRARWRTAVW